MHNLSILNKSSNLVEREIKIDLFNKFIDDLDTMPKTIDTYKKSLRQLFNFFSSNDIRYPKRKDIIAFKDYLKSNKYKPTTIQNYITSTKIFFRWTNHEGYYPNIADNVKGIKLDRSHKKDYLTSRQVKEVLGCINLDDLKGIRDYSILVLMITGGLRSIEIVRADMGDFRILGNNKVLFIQGKGKTEKTEYVKISFEVEKNIRHYIQKRGKVIEEEPLFTSLSNNSKGERLSTRSISEIVKNRFKKAGYNSKRLTAHSLRHTAVTLSLLSGKDITEVQQFARHININTTMIYNHSLEKSENSCNEAISRAIF